MQLESDAIRAVLDPDEQLLWSGRPGSLQPKDALLIATFVLLAAYAAWSAVQRAMDLNTTVILVAAAANLAVAAYAIAIRLTTFYGVTSKRVIIVSTLPQRRVRSLDLLTLGHVSLESHGEGRGTITLEPGRFGLVEGVSFPVQDEKNPAPRLLRIKDAQAVRDVIQDARSTLEATEKLIGRPRI